MPSSAWKKKLIQIKEMVNEMYDIHKIINYNKVAQRWTENKSLYIHVEDLKKCMRPAKCCQDIELGCCIKQWEKHKGEHFLESLNFSKKNEHV